VEKKPIDISSLGPAWRKAKCVTPAEPPPKPARKSPWQFQDRILFATLQRCPCGAVYPYYQSELGARFINTRTKTIWIIAGHPSVFNNSTPIITHWREEKITWCPTCLPAPEANQQIQLEFDFC
jgi:hypothetical protein